jgi:hypothetical protein
METDSKCRDGLSYVISDEHEFRFGAMRRIEPGVDYH